jgi:hypothetical protein
MPRNRFDVPRTFRRISEGGPQLGHRFVEAAVEINERMSRPEILPQLSSRYHLSGMVQEKTKNSEGLFLQLDPNAALPQLRGALVHLKNPKPTSLWSVLRSAHDTTPLDCRAG